MIKAITLLYRGNDLSRAEFQQHWRERHAGIIAALPGVRRYVQSIPLPECHADDRAGFDGFAELWADDTQAFRALAASPQYATVLEDEQRFLDRGATELILTDEVTFKDGELTTGSIKRIACLRRKAELSVEAFHTEWRDRHGPLTMRLPGLRRYAQSHARAGAYRAGRQPCYDGFDLAWFDDRAALQTARESAAGHAVRDDWARFVAAPLVVVLATEHVVVA